MSSNYPILRPWMNEWMNEMFYLTTHSTHFIYGYMASDIWLRTIQIVRKETRCRHIGYYLRLTARVLLYAPSHRQDSTYHGLCYTSRGALRSYFEREIAQWVHPMKDRSDDPSHHERTLYLWATSRSHFATKSSAIWSRSVSKPQPHGRILVLEALTLNSTVDSLGQVVNTSLYGWDIRYELRQWLLIKNPLLRSPGINQDAKH